MLDSQGSRLDFWSGQGVKLKNLMGQDLDPGRGWKYRCLCSVTPLLKPLTYKNSQFAHVVWATIVGAVDRQGK